MNPKHTLEAGTCFALAIVAGIGGTLVSAMRIGDSGAIDAMLAAAVWIPLASFATWLGCRFRHAGLVESGRPSPLQPLRAAGSLVCLGLGVLWVVAGIWLTIGLASLYGIGAGLQALALWLPLALIMTTAAWLIRRTARHAA